MKTLQLRVTGDKLEALNQESYVSGSYGYYTAEFTFDSEWDGLIPHLVVIENGTQRPDEVIIDNTHKIATTESGIMQISVYGLDSAGNKCISCNFVCIEVKQGGYTGFPAIPKDIWDGYQVIVLGYMERAEKAADAAEEAEKNIKNLSATATEGTEVSVKQTTTEEGIKLDFTLPRGKEGPKGKEGRGIESVYINADNELTVAYTDGYVASIGNVKGEAGVGIGAIVISQTSDLIITLTDGTEFNLGKIKGEDGHTPIRGTDYWTDDDKTEIVNEVLGNFIDVSKVGQ